MKRLARNVPARMTLVAAVTLLAAVSCAPPELPERHAIMVGIKNYATVGDLSYCDKDVEDLSALLSANGFEIDDPLIDGEATKDAILNAIRSSGSYPADSIILFYFSGHGERTADPDGEETAYIIPYDATLGDTSSYISSDEFHEIFAATKSRNRIVILDSCYSGGFVPASSGGLDTAPGTYDPAAGFPADYPKDPVLALETMARLAIDSFGSEDGSYVTVTAAGSNELSWESSTVSHGVFTKGFLDAATGGDRDGDGYLTLEEAYVHARGYVKDRWNSTNVDKDFLPRMSGASRDYVLFEVD